MTVCFNNMKCLHIIRTNNLATRAWLFSRLTTPPTRQPWDQSLLSFIRAPSHGQWFKISAGTTVAEQDKLNALPTLMPDQYLSDDAIRLSLGGTMGAVFWVCQHSRYHPLHPNLSSTVLPNMDQTKISLVYDQEYDPVQHVSKRKR